MFNNMEYVYEVYRERSFSKAAANLYISQPSLSATIKKTEQRVGQQLFDRSTNPIGLTDCGREYIRAVERMLDIRSEFETYLHSWEELKTGTLAIGASNFFASYILPPVVAGFKQKYPGVNIQMVEASTTSLERQLFKGALDMIIDNYDFDEGVYKKHFCYQENLVLAVPAAFATSPELMPFRLSAKDIREERHLEREVPAVPLERFQKAPFLLLRQGNDTRDRLENICREADFIPEIILELDQLATAYHVACQGLGATLVSDTLVKKMKPDEGIVFFKLKSPYSHRDVHFYHKNSKFVTRAMSEFMEMVTIY